MIAFLLHRLCQGVLVLLAIALIAFALFNYVGDPVSGIAGQDAGLADRARLRQELGLDDGVAIRFGRFVAGLARGDFGVSYQEARPVGQIIREKLPATLELSAVAALIAAAAGVPLGIYTALHRRGRLARALLALSLMGVSLPTFLIGILLILVFSVWLRWLPSFGRGGVVAIGWWTTGLLTVAGWRAILLPALTLALFQTALIMRLVRAEMIEVLRADFIRFGRARGLTARALNFGHALKNILVPVITIGGLQLGSTIAFAIITETVFQWPGMGLMFIQAVTFADIPIMAAYLVLVGLFFVTINLTTDLLYLAIDPRLRVERARIGFG
ncbi:MAG: ABC transporter permease [Alphaproteobacteria bacterium]|nr:ABC transporter permease [Alphaproteobacteria bacterium]